MLVSVYYILGLQMRILKILSCVCAQLLIVLCDPIDCRSSSSSVYGILQARILECIPPEDLPKLGSNLHVQHCRWILYQLS